MPMELRRGGGGMDAASKKTRCERFPEVIIRVTTPAGSITACASIITQAAIIKRCFPRRKVLPPSGTSYS